MSTPRQMPGLGLPTKAAQPNARREPQLPSGPTPVPARGPALSTPGILAGSR